MPSEGSKGPEFATYPVSLAIHEAQPATFTAVLKKEARKGRLITSYSKTVNSVCMK